MIRRDYFMRLVAEMAQVLARVLSLKGRKEYDEALREVDTALREVRDSDAGAVDQMTLEQWITLCRRHERAASGLMVAVADLLKEQGDKIEGDEKSTVEVGLSASACACTGVVLGGVAGW